MISTPTANRLRQDALLGVLYAGVCLVGLRFYRMGYTDGSVDTMDALAPVEKSATDAPDATGARTDAP